MKFNMKSNTTSQKLANARQTAAVNKSSNASFGRSFSTNYGKANPSAGGFQGASGSYFNSLLDKCRQINYNYGQGHNGNTQSNPRCVRLTMTDLFKTIFTAIGNISRKCRLAGREYALDKPIASDGAISAMNDDVDDLLSGYQAAYQNYGLKSLTCIVSVPNDKLHLVCSSPVDCTTGNEFEDFEFSAFWYNDPDVTDILNEIKYSISECFVDSSNCVMNWYYNGLIIDPYGERKTIDMDYTDYTDISASTACETFDEIDGCINDECSAGRNYAVYEVDIDETVNAKVIYKAIRQAETMLLAEHSFKFVFHNYAVYDNKNVITKIISYCVDKYDKSFVNVADCRIFIDNIASASYPTAKYMCKVE